MADNPKDLDTLLRAAFDAGVRHGAGYPELDAIPEEEKDIQFRAFLDDWQGNTWGPVEWREARVDAGLVDLSHHVPVGTDGRRTRGA